MMDLENMEMDYLEHLTAIIDNINDEPHITPEYVHEQLWQGINQLRHDPEREARLADWKYSTDFCIAEEQHIDEKKACASVNWEQSFTMFFYLCIYH